MTVIESSFHSVVRADRLTLPKAGGDRDVEIEFFVSFDAMVGTGDPSPYLLYRVNLLGEEPAHLVLRINGDEIVDQVIRDTATQCFHKVFGADSLGVGDNTFVIRVPDDQPGTVVVSDVVVVFGVHVLIPSSDDPPPPTGGPL